jgi:hypothetical protein
MDASSKAEALNELGYSVIDNLTADLVILTEGTTDIPVLEEFLNKMGIYGAYNIKFWPLCGDTMSQIDISVLTEKKNIVALIDKDPQSGHSREEFKSKCNELNVHVTQLKRYAIESYFPPRVLNKIFADKIKTPIAKIDFDKKLEDQLGFGIKKENRAVAKEMTLEEVKDSEDLYVFLEEVKRFLKTNVSATAN